MTGGLRLHPHLRLTAAILVAVLAALVASGESGSDSRFRRDGGAALRLLVATTPKTDATGDRRTIVAATADLAPGRGGRAECAASASARAERALRLDAAGPERGARLRTIALPPPRA